MCLAFSLVSMARLGSVDSANTHVAVLPSAVLPETARKIGDESTMNWTIGETYLVKVMWQADDPVGLYTIQSGFLALKRLTPYESVLAARLSAISQQADAAGLPAPKEINVEDLNQGSRFEADILESNDVKQEKIIFDPQDLSSDSCVLDRKEDMETFMEKLTPLFVKQASEDVCFFLKSLVKALDHIATQGERSELSVVVLMVCEALFARVRELEDAKLLRSQNMVQLDDLPDELLTKVFSFVPPADLLRSMRAVSTKWRELALHPSVWKHCRILDDSDYLRSAKLALRLAPCLYTIRAPHVLRDELDHDLCSTKCAIAHLSLAMNHESENGDRLQKVLLRQWKLGRLRSVYIEFRNEDPSKAFSVLEALEMCDLDEIRIDARCAFPLPAGPGKRSERRPLKQLCYAGVYSYKTREPLLLQLLSIHRSTLELVKLHDTNGLGVPLLSQCTNLREVRVPGIEEVEALLQCRQLRSVHLHLLEARVPGVISFLEKATHLTSVGIHIIPGYYLETSVSPYNVAERRWMSAISALASSCESSVEELVISDDQSYYDSDFKPSVAALSVILSGLPRLHHLELNCGSTLSFMEAITPESAPNLRMLHLRRCFDSRLCERGCVLPGVRELLKRNPLMHVKAIEPSLRSRDCRDGVKFTQCGCDCCSKGEHRLLPSRGAKSGSECEIYVSNELMYYFFGFYAHDPSHICGLHDSSLIWVWMGGAGPCPQHAG